GGGRQLPQRREPPAPARPLRRAGYVERGTSPARREADGAASAARPSAAGGAPAQGAVGRAPGLRAQAGADPRAGLLYHGGALGGRPARVGRPARRRARLGYGPAGPVQRVARAGAVLPRREPRPPGHGTGPPRGRAAPGAGLARGHALQRRASLIVNPNAPCEIQTKWPG